jgi:predicted ATPase/DNA-binding XRE family transcriptional regulator
MATGCGPGAFGVQLHRHRVAAGLSQEELAARAGLSRRGITDLERGARRTPHPATVRRLAEALDLSSQDRAAFQTASLSGDTTAAATALAGLTQLPLRLTSFIGRQAELAELVKLFDSARLVSLVGPGGIGKTRLAVEVARILSRRYADGTAFVDLATVAAPELAVPAVAQALGLRVEIDHNPEAGVFGFLAMRQLLLILDNCEHLVEACAELVKPLLRRSPGVTVLVTSREALGVEEEVLWRVASLDERSAARLFAVRARAQRAEFDEGDGVTVRQVCLALDCLPLAIELAAARVSLLAPAEILPRLEDRFALLGQTGRRGGVPRQQTLRATIDWSYELLEPDERQLFRQLAVFAGPFDLAAVTAISGPRAFDVLGRLVDKSLVIAQVGERATRFRLLDTLREYAWAQLRQSGEMESARQHHLDYFLGRAEALFEPTDSLDGPTRELDSELDNLRSAFEWCHQANARAGLRLIGVTRDVWWRRSFAEGRRWSKYFLDRCPEPSLARAMALSAAASFEVLGHPSETRRLLGEARPLAERFDLATLASVDYYLAFAAFSEEDVESAIRHFEHAFALVPGLGDERASVPMQIGLGWALLTHHDRREEGRVRLEHALERATAFGDRHSIGAAHFGLGLYCRWTGDLKQSLDHFVDVLEPLRDLKVIPTLAATLLHIARLVAADDPVRAARVAGAGLAIAERADVHLPRRQVQGIEQLRSELSQRLGREQARRVWTEGESLTIDEMITFAIGAGRREASVS